MKPPAPIDLNALLVFATVAETGGFTAAAERLGVAKAKVSIDIRRLETRLGTSLFHRTTRKVVLSDAGATLYEQSVPSLRGLLDALAHVADGEVSGTLRIACTSEHAVQSVAPAVAAFAQLHPLLRIEIRSSDRVVDQLAEGIDVAFRVGWLRDSSLRAVKVGRFEQHVLAAPSYLERAGSPKRPEDLASHDWVALLLLPAPLTWTFTGPDGAEKTVRMKARLSADASATLLSLLECGAGISAMHADSAAAAVRDGRLRRLLPRWRLPEGGIYAVVQPGRHMPASVRTFIEFYRAFLAQQGRGRTAAARSRAAYSPVP